MGFSQFCKCNKLLLQEAENTLRMMQHVLREEEERDLTKSSRETTATVSHMVSAGSGLTRLCSAVKDEDSDTDVPEDDGSDSDVEECRPAKPRPARNGVMAGTAQIATPLLCSEKKRFLHVQLYDSGWFL